MRDKNPKKWSHTIRPNDLVMVKKHLRETFDPKYGGTFRVFSIKGNQAQVTPVGLKHDPQMVHVSHLKQVFPANIIIDKIPDYSTFGRKTKLAIHPDQIPDLGWHHAMTLNTLIGEKPSLLAIFGEKGEGSYEHEKGVSTDGQVWSWKPSKHPNSLKTQNIKYYGQVLLGKEQKIHTSR